MIAELEKVSDGRTLAGEAFASWVPPIRTAGQHREPRTDKRGPL